MLVDVDLCNFGPLDCRLDWQALGIRLPRGTDLALRPPRCGIVPDRYRCGSFARLPRRTPLCTVSATGSDWWKRFSKVRRIAGSRCERGRRSRKPSMLPAATQRRAGALRSRLPRDSDRVVGTFAQFAADPARRLQATGQPVGIDFEETIVREVLAALPEPDLLWRSLSLHYRIGVPHLGSEFLTEQRRAAQERRTIETIAAESRVARERESAEQRLIQERCSPSTNGSARPTEPVSVRGLRTRGAHWPRTGRAVGNPRLVHRMLVPGAEPTRPGTPAAPDVRLRSDEPVAHRGCGDCSDC
jgi:hypothetical protein